MSIAKSSSIRELQPNDALRVFEILTEARSQAAFPIGPSWSEAQVAKECKDHEGWIFESESGQPAAFILYRKAADALEITFLATAINARGQGLMSELIGHMIRHLPVNNAIWLEVHEANLGARRLYTKSGFQEVGKRPRYYSDGGAAILYNYG